MSADPADARPPHPAEEDDASELAERLRQETAAAVANVAEIVAGLRLLMTDEPAPPGGSQV